MKEAKMRILEMVESGKISVEDAIKLIEALGPSGIPAYDFDEKFSKFRSKTQEFARDFGEKVEYTFKDAQPKFKAATKKVVEKTIDIVEELQKALNESLRKFDADCEADASCEETKAPDDEDRSN